MSALDFPDSTFGAVAAFYAIIHLPRAEQPALLRRVWLSHHDAETSRRRLQEAGFQITSAAVRSHSGETWLWVLAEKPDATNP